MTQESPETFPIMEPAPSNGKLIHVVYPVYLLLWSGLAYLSL